MTPANHEIKTIETEKKSIELMGSDDYGHLPYPSDLDKHSKSVIQKSTTGHEKPAMLKSNNTA